MRPNPYVAVIISLSVIFMSCVIVGCRKQAEPEESPSVTVAAEREEPSWATPFLDAAKSAAITKISADRLGSLHLSGLVLVILALVSRLFFGTWRDAAYAALLGLVPSVGAVLLTDFPAVVLLIPGCGLALLTLYLGKRILEWWTGYNAWQAVANEIEDADTGKLSLGKLVKNRFSEAGLAPTLDKALKPLEKLWKQQSINLK